MVVMQVVTAVQAVAVLRRRSRVMVVKLWQFKDRTVERDFRLPPAEAEEAAERALQV
jgi:hypothetical protein